MPQRLILEDDTTSYEVLIEPPPTAMLSTVNSYVNSDDDDDESYGPTRSGTMVPETLHVKLADVHRTIRGYTEYAIGAFKNLAIAEVEEITLKFNISISAEVGLPIIASSKAESAFEIQVKCKFPGGIKP